MIVSFHPMIRAHENLCIAGRDSLLFEEADLIRKADAVLLPQVCPEFLYLKVQEFKRPCFPDQSLRFTYKDKVGQLSLFEKFSIPYPPSRTWASLGQLVLASRNGSLGHSFPFVIKDSYSHEGDGVFVIKDLQDLARTQHLLEKRLAEGSSLITQDYVNAKGNVLRVAVFYKDLLAFWKKGRGEVITVSKGASIDLRYRPDLVQKGLESIRKARKELRIDLAAVDMAFDMDRGSGPFWLEINFFFGRRGLGGSPRFYDHLLKAVKDWLTELDLRPEVSLAS